MTFEKQNHHYVPQFWQRGFRDPSGQLYARIGATIKAVSPRTIMQQDWLYTVFDAQWNPSDALENALSATESTAALLFGRLCASGSATSADDRDELCSVLALQACRHPDIIGRGHRMARKLGVLLARAHSLTLAEFTKELAVFGVSSVDARAAHTLLLSRPPEQLASELEELDALSPQDPRLPEHDALRAQSLICAQLKKMEITLLDAPTGCVFLLGDTPMPQHDLQLGFSVPLSQSVAVIAQPANTIQATMSRRYATAAEVDAVNRAQWENSLRVIVGPSDALLRAL